MINSEMIRLANDGLATVPIKGKNYVMVKDRVTAFREVFPDFSLDTEIINLDEDSVTMKAIVRDEAGNIKATGHARELQNASFINKTSYVENCETSAIGRALGLLGIGIDDSFGSADEVANAIKQQNETQPEVKTITPAQAAGFKEILQRTNSDVKAFLKNFKVNSVEEIPADKYEKAQELLHKKYVEWQQSEQS